MPNKAFNYNTQLFDAVNANRARSQRWLIASRSMSFRRHKFLSLCRSTGHLSRRAFLPPIEHCPSNCRALVDDEDLTVQDCTPASRRWAEAPPAHSRAPWPRSRPLTETTATSTSALTSAVLSDNERSCPSAPRRRTCRRSGACRGTLTSPENDVPSSRKPSSSPLPLFLFPHVGETPFLVSGA